MLPPRIILFPATQRTRTALAGTGAAAGEAGATGAAGATGETYAALVGAAAGTCTEATGEAGDAASDSAGGAVGRGCPPLYPSTASTLTISEPFAIVSKIASTSRGAKSRPRCCIINAARN